MPKKTNSLLKGTSDAALLRCLGGGFESYYTHDAPKTRRWRVVSNNGRAVYSATLEGGLAQLAKSCLRRKRK